MLTKPQINKFFLAAKLTTVILFLLFVDTLVDTSLALALCFSDWLDVCPVASRDRFFCVPWFRPAETEVKSRETRPIFGVGEENKTSCSCDFGEINSVFELLQNIHS